MFAASRVARAAGRLQVKARSMSDATKPKGQYLFGEAPGTKTNEGWETIYIGGMALCFGTAIIGLSLKPNRDISQWARDEALAREILTDAGETLEVGRNYSQEKYGHVFTKAGHGIKPRRMADGEDDE